MGKLKHERVKARTIAEPYQRESNAMDTEEDILNLPQDMKESRGKILQRQRIEFKKLRRKVDELKQQQ
jgi:hypothetical protein